MHSIKSIRRMIHAFNERIDGKNNPRIAKINSVTCQ